MANTGKDIFLSTEDNPYDYFNDFDKWYAWDYHHHKVDCCSLLARFAHTSPGLSNEDNRQEIEAAVDRIIARFNPLIEDPKLKFKKVVSSQ